MRAYHKQYSDARSLPAISTGRDEELERRAQDDAFRAHLAKMADQFPQPNPAVSGQERK